jgi:hypothetical protein
MEDEHMYGYSFKPLDFRLNSTKDARQSPNMIERTETTPKAPMDAVTETFKRKQLVSKPMNVVVKNRQRHELHAQKKQVKENEGYNVRYVTATAHTSPTRRSHSTTFMFGKTDNDEDMTIYLTEEGDVSIQKGMSPLLQNEIYLSRGSSRASSRSAVSTTSTSSTKSRQDERTQYAKTLLKSSSKEQRREAILELLNYDREKKLRGV